MKSSKTFNTIILTITISLVVIVNANATNYYVSNSGDDSANGTSPATAWKTFVNINSTTFNPGDSILFERGGLFRIEDYDNSNAGYGGMIYMTESGSKNNHITFSSFGSGNKPKIYGSVASSVYEHYSGNIYKCLKNFPRNPAELPTWGGTVYDASIFFKTDNGTIWGDTNLMNIDLLDANYEWTWQNDTVYFYYNGSIEDIDSIEVTQQNAIFQLDGEYYTIDGLELMYFLTNSVGSSVYPEVTKNGMIVRNCEIAYSATREGGVGYGVDLHFSDMLIENNVVHDNGRRNLSFNIAQTSGSCTMRDVIIQDNYIYNGFHTVGIDIGSRGVNHQVRNITIRRNKIFNNPYETDTRYGRGLIWVYSGGDAGDMDSIYIYNNELLNTPTAAATLRGAGTSWIINNTITAFPYNINGAFAIVEIAGSGSKSTIMNNIFHVHPDEVGINSCIWGDMDRSVVQWDTVDYNLISITNDGNYYLFNSPDEFADNSIKQSQWSELVAEGWETHSLVPPQNPHFIDSLYSGKLKPGSPAIGNGCPISFVTTDIEGNPRDPINPDIGAYEYTSSNQSKIKSLKVNEKYTLYPNPASKDLNVQFKENPYPGYIVQLYDVFGKKVYESGKLNTKQHLVDLDSFATGIYFVSVIHNNLELQMEKLVVKK